MNNTVNNHHLLMILDDTVTLLALLEYVRRSGKYNMYMEFGSALLYSFRVADENKITINRSRFSNVRNTWSVYLNAYKDHNHSMKMSAIIDAWGLPNQK